MRYCHWPESSRPCLATVHIANLGSHRAVCRHAATKPNSIKLKAAAIGNGGPEKLGVHYTGLSARPDEDWTTWLRAYLGPVKKSAEASGMC